MVLCKNISESKYHILKESEYHAGITWRPICESQRQIARDLDVQHGSRYPCNLTYSTEMAAGRQRLVH